MDLLTETKKVKDYLRDMVREVVRDETNAAFRVYKARVITAPNGFSCKVQLIGDTTVLDLPYSRFIENAAVGDIVWVATINNSFSNAFVWEDISFGYSKYQRIEYIQSTGTQYIDTLFNCKTGMKVEAELEYTEITNYLTCAIGASIGGVRIYPFYPYLQKWSVVYDTFHDTGVTLVTNTRYKVESELLDGVQTLKVNGNLIYTGSDSGTIDLNGNAYVFGLNINSSVSILSKFKLYYLKMWQDGTLQRDFVPHYRKSDGENGLFEMVHNEFYTNAGTGDFVRGPEI